MATPPNGCSAALICEGFLSPQTLWQAAASTGCWKGLILPGGSDPSRHLVQCCESCGRTETNSSVPCLSLDHSVLNDMPWHSTLCSDTENSCLDPPAPRADTLREEAHSNKLLSNLSGCSVAVGISFACSTASGASPSRFVAKNGTRSKKARNAHID